MRTFRSSASFFVLTSALFLLTGSTAFASAVLVNRTTGTSASGQRWASMVSSSDGTKLAATERTSGDIWTSTDSGITWTDRTMGTGPSGLFVDNSTLETVTSSSDGTKLAAGSFDDGDIWTSSNSGATWTDASTTAGATGQVWSGITSSSDGTKLAAVVVEGDIWTSTDSGITWTNRTMGTDASGLVWEFIKSSSDGTKLAAVESNGFYFGAGDIWTSSDSGVTWTNRTTGTSASDLAWDDITSSSDGTKLAAVVSGGDIWTSTDFGVTWINRTTGTSASGLQWRAIISSSNGTELVATKANGDIWASSDSGVTWINETAGTSLSGLNWHTLAISADGTKLAVGIYGGAGDIWTGGFSPTLTTSAASSVSTTGATLNGDIIDTASASSTVRGFVYGSSTSYGATTTESGVFDSGAFTASLSSLTCATTYHYASYATNSYGTSYGSDTTFTTSACPVAAPPSNGPIAGGGGASAGPPPVALPFNGGASPNTSTLTPNTPTSPTTLSPAQTQALVTLYTSLLRLLEQEVAALIAARG